MQAETKFWDGIAPKYAKSAIRNMDAYTYTLERTRSYLKETDSVLEVGCGTGSTALLLADSVREITATDLSGGMLEIAQGKATDEGVDNVTFVKDDAMLGSIEATFDVVMGFNLYHLVPDIDAALARAHAALKPGGLLISKTPCLRGAGVPFFVRVLILALPILQMLGKAPSFNRISIAQWETAITKAGFEIIETGNFPARPPSRYVVARKV